MKRKHYDCIVAWAEGKEIEVKHGGYDWYICEYPMWHEDTEYRIKKEPVIEVKYFYVAGGGFARKFYEELPSDLGTKWDLKITYQDGKAIKAEVAE